MSHDKIFTQFPGVTNGEYHMLDINAIESISQSSEREVVVIFTATRYYSCTVETDALDQGNFPDAAQYCYQILANAAINAAAAERDFQQQVDMAITEVPQSGERDSDFAPPQ